MDDSESMEIRRMKLNEGLLVFAITMVVVAIVMGILYATKKPACDQNRWCGSRLEEMA
jgi:hypothetical protein